MDEHAPVAGERATSEVVNKKRAWLTRSQIIFIAAFGALLVLSWVISQATGYIRAEIDAPKKPIEVGEIKPWKQPADPNIQQVVAKPPPPPPTPQTVRQAMEDKPAQPQQGKPPPPSPALIGFTVPPVPEALKPRPAQTAATSPKEEHTVIDYKTSSIAGVKAGRFGDTRYKLKPGLLRCTMRTAVTSDLPGPFMCTLPGDVFSEACTPMSGRCDPLMPRGTLVLGTYDAQVKNGQKRLAASGLAAYAGDCVVPLTGMPMADRLGNSGLEGEVNTHFWEKFGFALILTAIDLGSSLGQAALQSGGGGTYLSFNGGGSGVSQLAQEVARQGMQIPPTIRVNQGEDVMIWLAQPTDFGPCYK